MRPAVLGNGCFSGCQLKDWDRTSVAAAVVWFVVSFFIASIGRMSTATQMIILTFLAIFLVVSGNYIIATDLNPLCMAALFSATMGFAESLSNRGKNESVIGLACLASDRHIYNS
jgi:hypothetical protein